MRGEKRERLMREVRESRAGSKRGWCETRERRGIDWSGGEKKGKGLCAEANI